MTVLVRVPLEHDVITDPVEEEKQTKKVFECERLSLWINYRLTRVLNSEPYFLNEPGHKLLYWARQSFGLYF